MEICGKSKKNENNFQPRKRVWNWNMLATTTNNDYGTILVLQIVTKKSKNHELFVLILEFSY